MKQPQRLPVSPVTASSYACIALRLAQSAAASRGRLSAVPSILREERRLI
jgi:hypothetical protein